MVDTQRTAGLMSEPEWASWPDEQAARRCGCAISALSHRGHRARAADRRGRTPSSTRAAWRPAALLAVGRVVHAGRRAGHRHPVLPRASAAGEARARADAGGRRRRPRDVPADPAPRGRPRHRQRLSAAPAADAAAAVRQSGDAEYPEYYTPKPYSKSFVQHLDHWYAQSHPDEDFAETFAVWLDPQSMWATRYAGWPAQRKLEYMDRLMRELRARAAARHVEARARSAAAS